MNSILEKCDAFDTHDVDPPNDLSSLWESPGSLFLGSTKGGIVFKGATLGEASLRLENSQLREHIDRLKSWCQGLEAENREWRGRFAMLGFTQIQEPTDDVIAPYTARAIVAADHGHAPFPYGTDPNAWPPPVREWLCEFTRELLRRVIVPNR